MSGNFPSERGADGDALDELRRKLAAVSPGEVASSPGSGPDDTIASSVPPHIRRLGDYELIDRLGEGGMGTVYLARQDSLAGRHVALKVLPPYFALDPRRVARFQNEAMTAAKVDHPGIVTILDIGEQDGVHFLVQELVPGGRTLAHWIDERRRAPVLPKGHYATVARLFATVADALQTVHAKHVIHRDIKPSNILLMPDGEPKVADFGLAKDFEGAGLSTSGESPGTPSYKSPEHIDRRIGAVDARSDVFSLGATLYETLTFRRPFDGDSEHEIYAKISDQEVEDPRAVRAGIPAELALICRKALEKEPRRRYGSMAELADDLRRYLANEPIRAQPPSSARRLQLWAKRNVVAAGLSIASVIVVATAAAAVWIVVGKNEELRRSNDDLAVQTRVAEDNSAAAARQELAANQARALADANARQARENAAQAQASERRAKKVSDFVKVTLMRSDPNQGGAQGYLVVDAMDQALRTLESGELKEDPETEDSLRTTIASILNGNGRSADGLELAKKALASQRQRTSSDALEIAQSINTVGRCLLSLGRYDEAKVELEASLAMSERLHAADDRELAAAWNNLGAGLFGLGQFEAALKASDSALAMMRRLKPGEDDADLAAVLTAMGLCLLKLDRRDEALLKLQESFEMSRRLFRADDPHVATALNNLAHCLEALGRREEALAEYEEVFEMRRRMFAGDHPEVAESIGVIAMSLMNLGRMEEALPCLEEALTMDQRLFPDGHPELATDLNNLGFCLESLKRWPDALVRHQEALAMRKRLFHGDHLDVASSFYRASRCLWTLGRHSDAAMMTQGALEMCERIFGRDTPVLVTMGRDCADCLDRANRTDEALPYAERADAMAYVVFANDASVREATAKTLERIRQRLSDRAAHATDEKH